MSATPAGEALLETRECTVAFAGLVAVSKLNLSMRADEIVALIGPNGAGKTTVFNMLTGIYPPHPGEIRFRGQPIEGLKPHQINRRGIARTFQNIRLFANLTTFENVLLACHATLGTGLVAATFATPYNTTAEDHAAERAWALLEQLSLASLAKERARNLSYGDQRRLEIARALATDPSLLLLDEPTAGMNPREKGVLAETVAKLHQEHRIAVLLIEHDMGVVMGISERIVVMDHGVEIAQGPPREIQSDPRVIEAYLGEPKVAVS